MSSYLSATLHNLSKIRFGLEQEKTIQFEAALSIHASNIPQLAGVRLTAMIVYSVTDVLLLTVLLPELHSALLLGLPTVYVSVRCSQDFKALLPKFS